MLYRPNFCCNCGEKIDRAEWTLFASRRFCELCETEKKEYDLFLRLIAGFCVLCGLFGIATFVSELREKSNRQPAMTLAASAPPAQASNRTANSQPTPDAARRPGNEEIVGLPAGSRVVENRIRPAAEAVFYCGAITKKGTPCTRRVKTKGAFCWQHAQRPGLQARDTAAADSQVVR